MKKKYPASSKDQKDWSDFIKQMGDVGPKEEDFIEKKEDKKKTRRLDLHGFSLNESNEKVKKFILDSFNDGYKKLLVITGKGTRSKSHENPYVSEKLNILRYSVPEFIKNDEDLNNKVSEILEAEIKDGGEGAMNIFLKNKKEFIK